MGLNEGLDQAEQAELRSRITSGARSLSHRKARRSRLTAVAVATAAVGIVVGASALALSRPDMPTVAETPTVSVTPSLTPTETAAPAPTTPPPTATPPPQTPVAAADGACENVIPSADLPSAIGAGALEETTDPALRTLGGLSCRWTGTWHVWVDLFPASVVPGAFVDRYAAEQCEGIGYDGYGCRVARATDELWALVTAGPGETTYGTDVPQGLVDEVADVIGAGLPDLAPGLPAERVGWEEFSGCEDLGSAVDLASALGDPPVEGRTGTDGSSPDPVHEIAAQAGAVIGPCVWSTDDDTEATRFPAIWVTVYPSGADGWDRLVEELAPTAVDTTVAGAEEAVIIDREDEVGQVGTGDPLTRLLVTDGESIVVLESRELARDARDVAAELLAAR
jgi:hypothetical protein